MEESRQELVQIKSAQRGWLSRRKWPTRLQQLNPYCLHQWQIQTDKTWQRWRSHHQEDETSDSGVPAKTGLQSVPWSRGTWEKWEGTMWRSNLWCNWIIINSSQEIGGLDSMCQQDAWRAPSGSEGQCYNTHKRQGVWCQWQPMAGNQETRSTPNVCGKVSFIGKRGRPCIQVPVAFLCIRAQWPTEPGWHKLIHMLNCLKRAQEGWVDFVSAGFIMTKWYADAAFAVHPGMKSHNRNTMSLGEGAINFLVRKRKLDARSSVEAKLEACDADGWRAQWRGATTIL